MDIEIREIKELSKKDHKQAIEWAIEGMHFNRFVSNKFLLNLYGKYFWYFELLKSTQIITAYYDNKFVGVLLSEVKGENQVYKSFSKKLFVSFFELIKKIFIKNDSNSYDNVNEELLKEYTSKESVDGEIAFLAADPHAGIKGIGTKIIEEYARREKGKLVYLFTDDSCTYQFYDRRGFDRVGEKKVELVYKEKKEPLICMLYSKRM